MKAAKAEAARKEAEQEAAKQERAKRDPVYAKHLVELRRQQKESDESYAKKIEAARLNPRESSYERERQIHNGCRVVYGRTIDKPIGELTGRDIDQIRLCKALGFYEP